MELGEIYPAILKHKDNGCRIIACCGCFDVFHIGHLNYLQDSKKHGDILVVGINSDESYRRTKGSAPFFSVSDRAAILEALRCVSYVFQFSEDTFCASLKTIRPSIFSVGLDKRNVDLPEKAICAEYGITLVYSGREKVTSSTKIKREYWQI